MGKLNNRSFTLIELIVAVAVVALVLPSIFNIFFVMIRQQIVLSAYQDMEKQGNSIARNIKYVLQNRAAQIMDNTYTIDICPLITTPTPTLFPRLYIKDKDENTISIYQSSNSVASESGKLYFLNTSTASISGLVFTCFKVNDFTPPYVSISYIVSKSALFKNVSLPYNFSVKLRDY